MNQLGWRNVRYSLTSSCQPTLIYKWTHNPRTVQLLLGHTNLECTLHYFSAKVDVALEIAEQTEI